MVIGFCKKQVIKSVIGLCRVYVAYHSSHNSRCDLCVVFDGLRRRAGTRFTVALRLNRLGP